MGILEDVTVILGGKPEERITEEPEENGDDKSRLFSQPWSLKVLAIL